MNSMAGQLSISRQHLQDATRAQLNEERNASPGRPAQATTFAGVEVKPSDLGPEYPLVFRTSPCFQGNGDRALAQRIRKVIRN